MLCSFGTSTEASAPAVLSLYKTFFPFFIGADLYEKLLTRRRQQECEQRECVRGVRSEETFLYQVLQHG